MSGLDKDRLRNQTISFRVSLEERQRLEARIKVSGMAKGQYFIQSLLHQEINIVVGKYQSDRLALELRRLRERFEALYSCLEDDCELIPVLSECNALLKQLCELMEAPAPLLNKNDFITLKGE